MALNAARNLQQQRNANNQPITAATTLITTMDEVRAYLRGHLREQIQLLGRVPSVAAREGADAAAGRSDNHEDNDNAHSNNNGGVEKSSDASNDIHAGDADYNPHHFVKEPFVRKNTFISALQTAVRRNDLEAVKALVRLASTIEGCILHPPTRKLVFPSDPSLAFPSSISSERVEDDGGDCVCVGVTCEEIEDDDASDDVSVTSFSGRGFITAPNASGSKAGTKSVLCSSTNSRNASGSTWTSILFGASGPAASVNTSTSNNNTKTVRAAVQQGRNANATSTPNSSSSPAKSFTSPYCPSTKYPTAHELSALLSTLREAEENGASKGAKNATAGNKRAVASAGATADKGPTSSSAKATTTTPITPSSPSVLPPFIWTLDDHGPFDRSALYISAQEGYTSIVKLLMGKPEYQRYALDERGVIVMVEAAGCTMDGNTIPAPAVGCCGSCGLQKRVATATKSKKSTSSKQGTSGKKTAAGLKSNDTNVSSLVPFVRTGGGSGAGGSFHNVSAAVAVLSGSTSESAGYEGAGSQSRPITTAFDNTNATISHCPAAPAITGSKAKRGVRASASAAAAAPRAELYSLQVANRSNAVDNDNCDDDDLVVGTAQNADASSNANAGDGFCQCPSYDDTNSLFFNGTGGAECRNDGRSSSNHSPFFIACQYGRSEVVSLFLTDAKDRRRAQENEGCGNATSGTGKKVHGTNHTSRNCTPPPPSSTSNYADKKCDDHSDCVYVLVNEVNHKHVTPLYIAAQEGHGDVLALLLEDYLPMKGQGMMGKGRGADDASNSSSLLQHSDEAPNATTRVKQFHHRYDNAYRTESGFTPLYVAAQCGFLRIVKLLVAAGADPAAKCVRDLTPLYIAAQEGKVDVVRYFLRSCRCNPHTRTAAGFSPLFIAAQFGHIRTVKCLIREGGCVPNELNAKGLTPMYIAAQEGHLAVVAFLYESAVKLQREQMLMEKVMKSINKTKDATLSSRGGKGGKSAAATSADSDDDTPTNPAALSRLPSQSVLNQHSHYGEHTRCASSTVLNIGPALACEATHAITVYAPGPKRTAALSNTLNTANANAQSNMSPSTCIFSSPDTVLGDDEDAVYNDERGPFLDSISSVVAASAQYQSEVERGLQSQRNNLVASFNTGNNGKGGEIDDTAKSDDTADNSGRVKRTPQTVLRNDSESWTKGGSCGNAASAGGPMKQSAGVSNPDATNIDPAAESLSSPIQTAPTVGSFSSRPHEVALHAHFMGGQQRQSQSPSSSSSPSPTGARRAESTTSSFGASNTSNNTKSSSSSYPSQLEPSGYRTKSVALTVATHLFQRTAAGFTPLFIAAQHGHTLLVKYLLEKAQCDPNEECARGLTPLYIACQEGKVDVIKYLLNDYRVFCETQYYYASSAAGATLTALALSSAVNLENDKEVEEHGTATAEWKQFMRRRIKDCLCANGEDGTTSSDASNVSSNGRQSSTSGSEDSDDANNGTSTNNTVAADDTATSPSPSAHDDSLSSTESLSYVHPNHRIAERENRRRRAALDAHNKTIRPFVLGATTSSRRLSFVLQSPNADLFSTEVDARQRQGSDDPTNDASSSSSNLHRPIFMDTRTAAGYSPIFIAAQHGHVKAVEYLIAASKCEQKMMDYEDSVAIGSVNVAGGAEGGAEHNNGASNDGTALSMTTTSTTPPFVDFTASFSHFFPNVIDVDGLNHNDLTALYIAASEGRHHVCKLLLAIGADAEVSNCRGLTPFLVAAENGRAEVCKVLFDSGCDMHVRARPHDSVYQKLVQEAIVGLATSNNNATSSNTFSSNGSMVLTRTASSSALLLSAGGGSSGNEFISNGNGLQQKPATPSAPAPPAGGLTHLPSKLPMSLLLQSFPNAFANGIGDDGSKFLMVTAADFLRVMVSTPTPSSVSCADVALAPRDISAPSSVTSTPSASSLQPVVSSVNSTPQPQSIATTTTTSSSYSSTLPPDALLLSAKSNNPGTIGVLRAEGL